MRTNLPVSTQEYPFPRGQTLVSTTDLKGRILYCNPSFIEVSGYEREELLGQPHNIVRHPDMPEEAYRDMWQTIASGQPWSAPVKNRRKDGDFYWVMANVTPLMDGDQPSGYMSVRTEATREQIQGNVAFPSPPTAAGARRGVSIMWRCPHASQLLSCPRKHCTKARQRPTPHASSSWQGLHLAHPHRTAKSNGRGMGHARPLARLRVLSAKAFPWRTCSSSLAQTPANSQHICRSTLATYALPQNPAHP